MKRDIDVSVARTEQPGSAHRHEKRGSWVDIFIGKLHRDIVPNWAVASQSPARLRGTVIARKRVSGARLHEAGTNNRECCRVVVVIPWCVSLSLDLSQGPAHSLENREQRIQYSPPTNSHKRTFLLSPLSTHPRRRILHSRVKCMTSRFVFSFRPTCKVGLLSGSFLFFVIRFAWSPNNHKSLSPHCEDGFPFVSLQSVCPWTVHGRPTPDSSSQTSSSWSRFSFFWSKRSSHSLVSEGGLTCSTTRTTSHHKDTEYDLGRQWGPFLQRQ